MIYSGIKSYININSQDKYSSYSVNIINIKLFHMFITSEDLTPPIIEYNLVK